MISILFLAPLFVGIIGMMFNVYKMSIIDAKIRGLKHPKLWGFITMGSQNGSGMILYLIRRRKYPVLDCSEIDLKEISRRKKMIGLALVFTVIGAIGFVVSLTLSRGI